MVKHPNHGVIYIMLTHTHVELVRQHVSAVVTAEVNTVCSTSDKEKQAGMDFTSADYRASA